MNSTSSVMSTSSVTAPVFELPLQGDFRSTPENGAEVSGPHRFVEVGGRVGYQPTSLGTRLRLHSQVHQGDRGTIVLQVCPLEALGAAAPMSHILNKDPNAPEYGLIGDHFPVGDIPSSVFCWYWRAVMHPQMIAKFKRGIAAGGAADFSVTPYVPVEHLPLHERTWYHLALTWDKPASRLLVYVNGVLCATTLYPFKCDEPNPELYLGNTAMVFGGVSFYDQALDGSAVAELAQAAGFGGSAVDEELRELFLPQERPELEWPPAAAPDWELRYQNDFTQPGALDGWEQQGCLEAPYQLKAREITPEGLLIQTPDEVHVETRMYLWSPMSFEGDLAVEYDFRPEQDTGLALLVVQASGMQREDFILDHPKRTTGAMGTIISDRVRNYHWEYFRKSVDCRGDLGTHVLIKNPWRQPLQMTTTPPLALHTWHRLQFVQEGARLRAAIDGRTVLDVTDHAFSNNGPVLNCGRIGLRLMYATRIRFRGLRVWNRNPVVVRAEQTRG